VSLSGPFSAGATGRGRHLFLLALIGIAVALVYGRVVGFEFLDYDDNLNVYENPLLENLSASNLLRFWQRPYEGLYIPLTYTVWAMLVKVSAMLFTLDRLFVPQIFHGANVVFHAANALTLFALLRLLLRKDWPAAAGALIFALHPLQVEAVAWVTGFKAVLFGLFSLLALWLYAGHGAEAEGQGAPRGWSRPRYLAATLCFLAAMLTMPSAVVLPLLAGIIGILPQARPWRRVGLELLPWLLVVVPVVLVTKASQPDRLQEFLPSVGQRFLVAGDALTFYLGKLVLPVGLGPDYGRTPEIALGQGSWVYVTGLSPYVLAAFLVWRCRNVWVWASAGIFVVTLAPVLGFLSFAYQDMSTVADRYCYLAMVGPALLSAWLLSRWPGWGGWALFLAMVFFLAVAASGQTRHWRDSLTFNNYALAVNPRSWMALHNLGLWYLNNGQMEDAVAQYEKALALKPNSFKAYNNLGMIYDRLGEKEKAITSYQKALALKPNYALVCNNIAVIYKGLGRYDEAIAYYQRALALDPEFVEVYANLANLHRGLGNAQEAERRYRQALSLRPNSAELANELGLFYAEQGQMVRAIELYRQALAVKPQFAEAHANLGVAYKNQGQVPEAIAAFRQAVAHSPEMSDAYLNLGVLLAGSGGQEEAIQMYGRAAALQPNSEIPLYALGTLYLELGRDQEARAELEHAVAINPDFGPAYGALSWLSLRAQDYERAVELVERAEGLGFVDQAQLDALAPYRKR